MKLKNTLLIAAAALVAGVISSEAQVYSQNVVGYVNKPIAVGQYNALCVPFKCGVSNGANEVFGTQLPDGTQLFQWTGTGYNVSGYDSQIGVNPTGWYTGGFDDVAPMPVIPVGQGFFIYTTANFTNTYTGNVAINAGSSATNTAVVGQYNMLGSILPVGGAVSNAFINFYPPDGTQLFQWTGNGYNVSGYDSQIGVNPSGWYTGGFDDVAPVPTIAVGEGYFVYPTATYKWKQSY